MGKIEVTVQTEERMAAITELSKAINRVAIALSTPPQITISNVHIENSDPGIKIDTTEGVTETIIKEIED